MEYSVCTGGHSLCEHRLTVPPNSPEGDKGAELSIQAHAPDAGHTLHSNEGGAVSCFPVPVKSPLYLQVLHVFTQKLAATQTSR